MVQDHLIESLLIWPIDHNLDYPLNKRYLGAEPRVSSSMNGVLIDDLPDISKRRRNACRNRSTKELSAGESRWHRGLFCREI